MTSGNVCYFDILDDDSLGLVLEYLIPKSVERLSLSLTNKRYRHKIESVFLRNSNAIYKIVTPKNSLSMGVEFRTIIDDLKLKKNFKLSREDKFMFKTRHHMDEYDAWGIELAFNQLITTYLNAIDIMSKDDLLLFYLLQYACSSDEYYKSIGIHIQSYLNDRYKAVAVNPRHIFSLNVSRKTLTDWCDVMEDLILIFSIQCPILFRRILSKLQSEKINTSVFFILVDNIDYMKYYDSALIIIDYYNKIFKCINDVDYAPYLGEINNILSKKFDFDIRLQQWKKSYNLSLNMTKDCIRHEDMYWFEYIIKNSCTYLCFNIIMDNYEDVGKLFQMTELYIAYIKSNEYIHDIQSYYEIILLNKRMDILLLDNMITIWNRSFRVTKFNLVNHQLFRTHVNTEKDFDHLISKIEFLKNEKKILLDKICFKGKSADWINTKFLHYCIDNDIFISDLKVINIFLNQNDTQGTLKFIQSIKQYYLPSLYWEQECLDILFTHSNRNMVNVIYFESGYFSIAENIKSLILRKNYAPITIKHIIKSLVPDKYFSDEDSMYLIISGHVEIIELAKNNINNDERWIRILKNVPPWLLNKAILQMTFEELNVVCKYLESYGIEFCIWNTGRIYRRFWRYHPKNIKNTSE